jgi:hypothetical protein
MVIEHEDYWWGFSESHGWVVVDWADPRNRPGYESPRRLYMVRCRDWQEWSIPWSEWSTPGYVSSKERLVSCSGAPEQAAACPPEDVGGVWGYADFVEAVQNPDHEQHEEMLEWVGGSFDPEAFDPAEATRRMKKGLPDWRRMR